MSVGCKEGLSHIPARIHRQDSFGRFTLDVDGGFLRCGAEEVALRPKPFQGFRCENVF